MDFVDRLLSLGDASGVNDEQIVECLDADATEVAPETLLAADQAEERGPGVLSGKSTAKRTTKKASKRMFDLKNLNVSLSDEELIERANGVSIVEEKQGITRKNAIFVAACISLANS